MKRPITTQMLFGLALFGGLALTIAISVIPSGAAWAQNAQWNALFDRIIRLEANVKNLSRGGGGGSGGYQQTRNNDQMRQLLNEIRQMRQQLLTMDARLRRLEKNSGRSGALRPRQPAYKQPAYKQPTYKQPAYRPQPPVRSNNYTNNNRTTNNRTGNRTGNQATFAQSDLEQYSIDREPQIFVEIGEAKDRGAVSHGVPVAPIARAPATRTRVARAPTNWQSAAPTTPPSGQPNTSKTAGQVAALPPQNNAGVPQNGVVRQSLDGNQITQQSVAKKLYDRSAAALRSRRYGAAESGFKSFLRKHAAHDLASGAQFMLGETYYVQRNWRLAAQSYLKGYRKYPNGNRAGDTLLKLGMSLGKLGQKSQSCGAFEAVVSKYKTSGSAVLQAEKEMKRAKC